MSSFDNNGGWEVPTRGCYFMLVNFVGDKFCAKKFGRVFSELSGKIIVEIPSENLSSKSYLGRNPPGIALKKRGGGYLAQLKVEVMLLCDKMGGHNGNKISLQFNNDITYFYNNFFLKFLLLNIIKKLRSKMFPLHTLLFLPVHPHEGHEDKYKPRQRTT
jgi:hypothetical protein